MSFLSVLATVFGTSMGLANAFQAIKIFRRKSASDISILTFSVILAGSVVWVLYGIEIGDLPIVFANSVGVLCVSSIIVGWFLYR